MSDGLDGTWRCRGYGRMLAIAGDEVAWFDTTGTTVVESARTSRDELHQDYDRIEVRADRLRLFEACGINRYSFDRADALGGRPIRAGTLPDPLLTFRAFREAFAEQYAFFGTRGVDWDVTIERAGRRLTSGPTDENLTDAMSDAIAALADGHVVLRAGNNVVRSSPTSPSPDALTWIGKRAGLRHRTTLANGQLAAGYLSEGVGYIALLRMHRWADPNVACANVAAAESAIDTALEVLKGASGIVVDVRFNGGGFDAVGLAVAARFVDRARLAFTKDARDGAGWTEPQHTWLEPAGPRQFTGPTALLVGPSTASAAEVFALAMRELPHVTLIGAPTQGILSDELEKTLPNGWTVSLSNERYRTPEGTSFEAIGIPPDVVVEPGELDLDDQLLRGLHIAREAVVQI